MNDTHLNPAMNIFSSILSQDYDIIQSQYRINIENNQKYELHGFIPIDWSDQSHQYNPISRTFLHLYYVHAAHGWDTVMVDTNPSILGPFIIYSLHFLFSYLSIYSYLLYLYLFAFSFILCN